MRTKIFQYKGILGIESSFDTEGLINNPKAPGQLGFVLDASFVDISKEALEVLKKIPKSGDDIGDVDVFKSNKGVVFAWLGGPLRLINPSSATGSNSYNPSLLESVSKIVENEPPIEFKKVVDKSL